METFGYFIFGLPGETTQSMEKTLQFAIKSGLDYVRFAKLLPVPNTEIYNKMIILSKYDYWKEYTKNKNTAFKFKRYDSNLSEEEINHYVNYAFKRFYFRPTQIIKKVLNINSSQELRRLINAGLDMIC